MAENKEPSDKNDWMNYEVNSITGWHPKKTSGKFDLWSDRSLKVIHKKVKK